MILYKDSKAIVHPLDGETDFFYIVFGVLQKEPYLFIIC